MNEIVTTEPARVRLSCLAGEPAPAEVARDWARLLALPERARQSLWDILGPALAKAPAAELDERATAFCRLYGVTPADLEAGLRVCRFLLSRAASLDVPASALAEDIAALSGGQHDAVPVLLAGYEAVKGALRREIVEETLLDHGKVLVGVDWRVDSLLASDRGVQLDAPVALLTLRLRDSGREEKLTAYVVPEALGQLQQALAKVERVIAAARKGVALRRAAAEDN